MLFPKPVGNTLPLNLFFPTHSVLFPSALLWSTLRKWCYTPLQHDFALDPIIPPFNFHFRIYKRDLAILTEWVLPMGFGIASPIIFLFIHKHLTLRKWCYTPLQHDFALEPMISTFVFHFSNICQLLLKSLPINIINCIKFYVNCSALTGVYDWQYKYLFVCLYANHLPWYIAVIVVFS
jgi:hypothetical protein